MSAPRGMLPKEREAVLRVLDDVRAHLNGEAGDHELVFVAIVTGRVNANGEVSARRVVTGDFEIARKAVDETAEALNGFADSIRKRALN